jgi:hypothetical protein
VKGVITGWVLVSGGLKRTHIKPSSAEDLLCRFWSSHV